MTYLNDELRDAFLNTIDSFLSLNETIRYFHKIESDLKKTIPECPTESDRRLFKRCLRYAECSRANAEIAMLELEHLGYFQRVSINRLTSSINTFNREFDLVRKRSYEIIDLLENNKA